ncbi:hypothetical protein GOC69_17670 [Sinorhizobium medicae]|nr:hypothetical protein [Sinorhizobium medicae]MDX0473313.1 hypothetical protein [Sinorhizobium medicae]
MTVSLLSAGQASVWNKRRKHTGIIVMLLSFAEGCASYSRRQFPA